MHCIVCNLVEYVVWCMILYKFIVICIFLCFNSSNSQFVERIISFRVNSSGKVLQIPVKVRNNEGKVTIRKNNGRDTGLKNYQFQKHLNDEKRVKQVVGIHLCNEAISSSFNSTFLNMSRTDLAVALHVPYATTYIAFKYGVVLYVANTHE